MLEKGISMKVLNRMSLRMGRTATALVCDDKAGPSEIHVCPISGDVEVWLDDKCLYKKCSHEGFFVMQSGIYRYAKGIAKRADKAASEALQIASES